MSWDDPSILQWWLPAGYVAVAAVGDLLWRGLGASPSKRKETTRGEIPDSIRTPLLQEDDGRELRVFECRCSLCCKAGAVCQGDDVTASFLPVWRVLCVHRCDPLASNKRLC